MECKFKIIVWNESLLQSFRVKLSAPELNTKILIYMQYICAIVVQKMKVISFSCHNLHFTYVEKFLSIQNVEFHLFHYSQKAKINLKQQLQEIKIIYIFVKRNPWSAFIMLKLFLQVNIFDGTIKRPSKIIQANVKRCVTHQSCLESNGTSIKKTKHFINPRYSPQSLIYYLL